MLQYIIKYKDNTYEVITEQNKIISTTPELPDLMGANFNTEVCKKCLTILSKKRLKDEI